ncbi:uncharacterized protein LOC114260019 isoform X3 [Camellia sinensis]|uniref:uncharacterized protein LOC114260019 isoform X3 n=1 Tax=Camellia sinensis TaxID=4442 RepID=UPI001035B38A|nr:uncharacterized protein LOC114260019 isoform X3 [Camellia sinensis]
MSSATIYISLSVYCSFVICVSVFLLKSFLIANFDSMFLGTFEMGNTKTEINLMRLLAASPHQQNQSKLIHYVATLREQLEELAEKKTPDGLRRVSKVQVNDYSEKVEAIASKLAIPVLTMQESQKPFAVTSVEEGPSKTCGESPILPSPKLRRRFMPQSNIEDKAHNSVETHQSASVKLDAVEQIHIEKHRYFPHLDTLLRKLQDDLTDEMAGLAQQLKESSLMMNQSIKNTEKVLDSTEAAIEHSLASTGCASTRAMEIY